jgi:short-subunit dehydrogenase
MTPVQTAYIVGKHAVLSFSECLFLEMQRVAPMIRVSAALPGPVATSIFKVAPGGASPATIERHRAIMEKVLADSGLHPDEAGRMIVDQAATGRFWIATHPQMLRASADARARHLSGLLEPELKPSAAAILGDATPAAAAE